MAAIVKRESSFKSGIGVRFVLASMLVIGAPLGDAWAQADGVRLEKRQSGSSSEIPSSGYGGISSNINENAKEASSQEDTGMITNMIYGGAMTAAFVASCFYGCDALLGAMAAQGIAQAAMMAAASGGSDDTAAATEYDMPGYNSSMNRAGDVGEGIEGAGGLETSGYKQTQSSLMKEQMGKIKAMQQQLSQRGISVSSDGKMTTLPDGRTVPSSAFGSPEGLAALGFSAEDIANAEAARRDAIAKTNAQLKGRLKIGAIGLDEGGGGGGGGAGGPGRAGKNGGGRPGFDIASLFANKKKRKPIRVQGLSKKLGSDSIGVAADNIFDMISRQYRKEEGKHSFIESAAPVVGPQGGRLPSATGRGRPQGL